MSFNLITLLVFIFSSLGIIIMVFRKIPILVELPESPEVLPREKFYLRLKAKIKDVPFLRSLSFDIFLQKILSKIRVLSLKTDNKTFNWLQKLRNKSQEDKFGKDDNYWQEIRNSKDLKK